MKQLDISKYLLPLSTIPQIELPTKGGFTNKLPFFQNNLGACGAMSLARALSRVFDFPVSTLWIYVNAKLLEDSFDTEGLTFDSLVIVACEIGVIPESMFNYTDELEWNNKELLKSIITDEMIGKAKQYKVKGVVKLNTSREIKQSLANKLPVIWGATISEDFRFDEDGHVLLSGIIVGGHAMNLPNYDSEYQYKFDEFDFIDKGFINIDQTWKIENNLWGDDGIGHISERALDDEIVVIEGQPGFKLWSECYSIIPFENERIAILKPKKIVELWIDKKEYKVDGIYKTADVSPYIEDSRTMVSLRFVGEALGFKVEWLADTREIIIGDQFGDIKLKVDSKDIYFHSVVQELDWIKSEKQMDVPVLIKDNRSFVPIRFIAEKLSCEVKWNNEERKITVEYY